MKNSDLKSLMGWIDAKIQEIKYGEIHITIKCHDGRPKFLEKAVITRDQLSGNSEGGDHGWK